MLSKGAVVVIKRGDTALTQMIEDNVITQARTPAEFREMERRYAFMCVAYRKLLANAIMESRAKYTRKKRPTPKPLLYLQIGYAMVACAIAAVRDWIFSRIKHGC